MQKFLNFMLEFRKCARLLRKEFKKVLLISFLILHLKL